MTHSVTAVRSVKSLYVNAHIADHTSHQAGVHMCVCRPATTFSPLVLVLGVSMIKEALEDFKRYRADKEVNARLVEVYDPQSHAFVKKRWEDTKVSIYVHKQSMPWCQGCAGHTSVLCLSSIHRHLQKLCKEGGCRGGQWSCRPRPFGAVLALLCVECKVHKRHHMPVPRTYSLVRACMLFHALSSICRSCRWERLYKYRRTRSFLQTCSCYLFPRVQMASAMLKPSTWMARQTSRSRRRWTRPSSLRKHWHTSL